MWAWHTSTNGARLLRIARGKLVGLKPKPPTANVAGPLRKARRRIVHQPLAGNLRQIVDGQHAVIEAVAFQSVNQIGDGPAANLLRRAADLFRTVTAKHLVKIRRSRFAPFVDQRTPDAIGR